MYSSNILIPLDPIKQRFCYKASLQERISNFHVSEICRHQYLLVLTVIDFYDKNKKYTSTLNQMKT